MLEAQAPVIVHLIGPLDGDPEALPARGDPFGRLAVLRVTLEPLVCTRDELGGLFVSHGHAQSFVVRSETHVVKFDVTLHNHVFAAVTTTDAIRQGILAGLTEEARNDAGHREMLEKQLPDFIAERRACGVQVVDDTSPSGDQ